MIYLALVLASYRLTRLITVDTIFDAPRNWLLDRIPEKVAEGLSCGHCVSVWVSGAMVTTVDAWFYPMPLPVLVWGAVAGAVSLLVGWSE